ncbi:hypothetical protein LJR090_002094 [Bosea sp. LjRoot90]|uniref:hypothetical protein n=1 Tax=Bosea sp. LjRoot90 TaxID=3342342 RepID=UPI003ED16188
MAMLIPAEHAEIHFNRAADFQPSDDVFVCDRRDRKLGTDQPVIIASRFQASYGAMNSGWMKGSDRTDTPEGVFASEWLNSPVRVSLPGLKAVLRELGKIDRCEWARTMFAAIEWDPEFGTHGEEE